MTNRYPFALCCLSPTLSDRGFSMKTMTAKKFISMSRPEAMKELSQRTLNNIIFTLESVKFCATELNITGYRMSSEVFPLINYSPLNITIEDYPDKEEILKTLVETGDVSRKLNMRLSFHPSEYTTMTSENPECVENSIRDLEHHAWIMDVMGLPNTVECPINFHIRKDGDPDALSKTAISNINKLSNSCRNRITLEVNDNKNGVWTVENLKKYFFDTMGIPVVFDSLHSKILHGNKTLKENMNIAKETWGEITPLFHYSYGIGDTRSHADFSEEVFPNLFLNSGCHWDIELKSKCLAIKKIISEIKQVN